MIPDQIPQYVKNGSLEPVDDVVEPDKDKFLPAAIPGLTVDGKVYGAPIYHTVTTTMYNKTVLDQGRDQQAAGDLGRDQGGRAEAQGGRLLHAGLLGLARGDAEPELLPAALAGRRQGVRRRRQDGRLQPGPRPGGADLPEEPVRRGRDPEERA